MPNKMMREHMERLRFVWKESIQYLPMSKRTATALLISYVLGMVAATAVAAYCHHDIRLMTAYSEERNLQRQAEEAVIHSRRYQFVQHIQRVSRDSLKNDIIERIGSRVLTVVGIEEVGTSGLQWEITGSLQDYLTLAADIGEAYPTVRVQPLQIAKKEGLLHIRFRTENTAST